jgi:hypothetical protein
MTDTSTRRTILTWAIGLVASTALAGTAMAQGRGRGPDGMGPPGQRGRGGDFMPRGLTRGRGPDGMGPPGLRRRWSSRRRGPPPGRGWRRWN